MALYSGVASRHVISSHPLDSSTHLVVSHCIISCHTTSYLCTLCFDNRPLFISEQRVYSQKQLAAHLRSLPGSMTAAGGDKTGGHPLCTFCSTNFFDACEFTYTVKCLLLSTPPPRLLSSLITNPTHPPQTNCSCICDRSTPTACSAPQQCTTGTTAAQKTSGLTSGLLLQSPRAVYSSISLTRSSVLHS